MSDFPSLPPLPLFVHTFSEYSFAKTVTALAVASITNPVANQAIYVPMCIPWNYPVARVFWANGSSVTTTNMDFGIYSESGARIYSTGSTAASGASTLQYVDATDFSLSPGRYYFALVDSSTTANRGGSGTTTMPTIEMRLSGMFTQTSSLPLPTDMTPASVANAWLPLFGVTRTSTGF